VIIGPKKLLQLVKKDKLIENLSERELKNPEGAGFDLRLNAVYEVSGDGFLGIEERKTPNANLLAKYKKGKSTRVVLKPGKHYIVSTIEKLNLPLDITANIWLRRTLYMAGIILSGGNTAPGYSGVLSFSFYNFGKSKVDVELGARIIHILFYRIEGVGSQYRGQWQGGRVTATKKEKQV